MAEGMIQGFLNPWIQEALESFTSSFSSLFPETNLLRGIYTLEVTNAVAVLRRPRSEKRRADCYNLY